MDDDSMMLRIIATMIVVALLTNCEQFARANREQSPLTPSSSSSSSIAAGRIIDGSVIDKAMVVDSKTGIVYNPYSKNHPGRRVCVSPKDESPHQHHRRLSHHYNRLPEKLFYTKNSIDKTLLDTYRYTCCPGWTQWTPSSHGCTIPHCSVPCENGGRCVQPNRCHCPSGFVGRHCEVDVNECETAKPCDQICTNTYGSYRCDCREDYQLQADRRSCKRERDDDADGSSEAIDIQLSILDGRLIKLENSFHNNNQGWAKKDEVNWLKNNLGIIVKQVDSIKDSLHDMMELRKDVTSLKDKVTVLEKCHHHVKNDGDEKLKNL